MLEYGWKRLLSGLLALVLVAGMFPAPAFATETEPETQPTVVEETTVESTAPESESVPENTETVTLPVEPTEEETLPEASSEATEVTVPETTEPALPENVATVQALIDALPTVDSATAEDYDAVQAAFDAYEALTEEEKALVQGTEVFEVLFAWFNAQISTLDTVASGTCGENLTWVLTEDGTLTISGTGDMEDYNWGGMPWSSYRGTITSVVIEEGVTSIGRYAFNDCGNLTSVTIPASVTSVGSYAFQWCNNLTHITFAHRATDELTIGGAAFYMESYSHNNAQYCPTTVVVASAKNVHPAISQCNWGYRTLTYISAMELPAQSMSIQPEKSEAEVGIEIPMTLKVEPADTTSDILWSVIPGTGTATVTRQGVVTGLTAGTVTVRATSGDNGDIYAEASLTILPPTGGAPTAITITTGGLYENEVAVGQTIPMIATFTPANASNRNVTWEVQNGTGTARIDQQGNLAGLTPGAVTVYATTDNGLENSCTVNVVRYAEEVQIFLDGKTGITSMGIGETKYLSAVLTPENTTTAEVEWWIVRGTGAAELSTSYKYNSNGNEIQVARITGTEAGTVTVVATAKDSHAVVAKAELEITDTVRSYAVTGGNIYYNTETGWITSSDSTVTDVVIPSVIEGTTIVGIAPDAFGNNYPYTANTTLTSVSIPATVREIGNRAFCYCTALSNLRFAGTSQLTTIGEQAFYYCKSLANLTVPESVTTVGDEAFCYLSGLKKLTISGEADSHRWGFGYYYDECLESITYTGSYIRSGERTTYPSGGYSTKEPLNNSQ